MHWDVTYTDDHCMQVMQRHQIVTWCSSAVGVVE